ncbi:MAG TPA: hypothetical protein VFE15_10815 [Marmoricola sp.]|jgi:hypothetical protein|nr:hypothetical protein [Marmoricola sp.]
MARERPEPTDAQQFWITLVGFGILVLFLGLLFGQGIAEQLQKTPTTRLGWLFFGWILGGPPFAYAALIWNERGRMPSRRLRGRLTLAAGWMSLSMLIVPSRVTSVEAQFGEGSIVGHPLAAGWTWGFAANVVVLIFGGAVLLIQRQAVPGGLTRAQKQFTARFLEAVWLVLLVVSLGFALYGNGSGLFNNGV